MTDKIDSLENLLWMREYLKQSLKNMENSWEAEYPDHEKAMVELAMIEAKLRALGWKPSS